MMLFVIMAMIVAVCASLSCPCDYATSTPPTAAASFITCMSFWEGKMLPYATWPQGVTKDGAFMDTDGVVVAPHNFSAASKESLHLALLARAVEGDEDARLFLTSSKCVHMSFAQCALVAKKTGLRVALGAASSKMDALERFNATFPGFGGFLPWFTVNETSGVVMPMSGWKARVPSLDNGQMIWGLVALSQALRNTGADAALLARVDAYLDMLRTTAVAAFYAGHGWVRAVASIRDVYAAPTPSNFATETQSGFLDDPYEGELFTQWLYLFGRGWPNATSDRQQLWLIKRAALVPVEFHGATVQRGFWFSAHEQWKYAYLPYLDVPIHKTLFSNGERARVLNSALLGIPGLYASINSPGKGGPFAPDYHSDCGIAALGSQPIFPYCPVTPYGVFPLLLANQTAGLIWYAHMVRASGMHGVCGSMECISVNGSLSVPLMTWDAKITTVVSALGGIVDLTRQYLTQAGQLSAFTQIIDEEWRRAFPVVHTGIADFALPTKPLSSSIPPFPNC